MALPIYEIVNDVNAKLSAVNTLVVCAPPGAGKSTVLPLTILEAFPKWKILMLEPRRIAAREVASRMAASLGENVGETVGYRVRFESKVSSSTSIEVITEGILTRMLIDDPTLDGVDAVIFDEFHERSLDSDLALALVRESQRIVRPDLKLVIMSATIDAEEVCKELAAPLVSCEGKMFPVEIINSRTAVDVADIPEAVAHTIRQALKDQSGDALAFLPGEWEIRRCMELLENLPDDVELRPLYGMMTLQQQRDAIAPCTDGRRRVVLATPIAETSLTIDGVRIVVDSGYCRKAVFNPVNSLSAMETVRISMDMATQRMGRAGRTQDGVCYRLWDIGTQMRMKAARTPEILEADLASASLSASAWGCGDISSLRWITPPPSAAIASAKALLSNLGAIDADGTFTPHGRKLSSLPCHPRIAQMLLSTSSATDKALAADVAALIEDKDPMPQCASADLSRRVEELRHSRCGGSRGVWRKIAQTAGQYTEMLHVSLDNGPVDPYAVGALVAAAYPERVGKELDGGGCRYLLAGGEQAFVPSGVDGFGAEFIAVAALKSGDNACTIFLAAPLAKDDALAIAAPRKVVGWDSSKCCVAARNELRIGRVCVESKPLSGDIRNLVYQAIAEAAPKEGASMFDFSDQLRNLQRRIAFAAARHPEFDLPDCSDEALLNCVSQWLPLYFDGSVSASSQLKRIDLCKVVWGLLDYGMQQRVEACAPATVEVPTGSHIRIEYRSGADAPVLRVRLQECFGLIDTPCIDSGRVPLLMELLSPGFKPVQLTSDLRSFWQNTYFEVRKELRMRYPRHFWQENPLDAQAIRGPVKRK